MVVIAGILEEGYESTMEHLCWRQLKGAWQVGLALVPHDYPDMASLLQAYEQYARVFVIPPGRMRSVPLDEYRPPNGDVIYVFGRPGENLVRYVREEDTVVSILTPGATDMMAISVVGIILNEHRQ